MIFFSTALPALVQADPELVLISLFPILERGDWKELLDRSTVLLDGQSIPEATRARLRWMQMRALAGAYREHKVRREKVAAILDSLRGQHLSFPLKSMEGTEGWSLAPDGLSAFTREQVGSRLHAEIKLVLRAKASPTPDQVVADGVLQSYEIVDAGSSSFLVLRFAEGQFLKS